MVVPSKRCGIDEFGVEKRGPGARTLRVAGGRRGGVAAMEWGLGGMHLLKSLKSVDERLR